MTEFRESLPSGWTKTAIEDLFAPLDDGRTLHQGWSPQCDKEPSLTEDSWGVLKTTSIQAAAFLLEHNKMLPPQLTPRPLIEVKAGDILITCAGPRARCGVACLVRHTRRRLMISGKMYRFRVPNNLVDPRYVEAYLQTATAQTAINQMKTGGSDSGLNLTHARFRQLQVPVAPLREQRRIVEKIDRLVSKLDVGVLALKRVQTNLKRYRAAVLKDACLGRLVPTEAELARSEGRSYEPATQLMARVLQEHRVKSVSGQPVTNFSKADQVDTTGLPALPEGWAWTTINAFLREPLRNGHSARASRDGSGIRTLTLTAVTSDDFSEMNTKLTVAAPDDVADLWLTPGDILIERSNTPELVGTAALYRGRARYAIFPDLLIRVRLLSSISKEYVTYVLQSQHGREYFRRSAQGIAGTMPKVDQTTVERFPVPVPPLAEQQRIVKELEMRISIVRELGVLVAANIKRAKRLRQSILKRAFEGKLVPQDPSDEPASILLERIGAERQAAKPDRESRRQTREIRIGRRAGCTDG